MPDLPDPWSTDPRALRVAATVVEHVQAQDFKVQAVYVEPDPSHPYRYEVDMDATRDFTADWVEDREAFTDRMSEAAAKTDLTDDLAVTRHRAPGLSVQEDAPFAADEGLTAYFTLPEDGGDNG